MHGLGADQGHHRGRRFHASDTGGRVDGDADRVAAGRGDRFDPGGPIEERARLQFLMGWIRCLARGQAQQDSIDTSVVKALATIRMPSVMVR